VAFVPEQAAVQEFAAAGLHPSLHDRVHPWHPDAGEYGLDPGFGEDLVYARGELAVTVSDQEACPAARVLQVHDEVPYRLGHPSRGGVSGGAKHADAPGGVLDDGQNVVALPV
jgi:hypothetical protein